MILIIVLFFVFDRFFFCILIIFIFFFIINYLIYLIVVCMVGYYGDNCIKICGNCLDDKICNNVNGICIDGCKEGFKGDFCIISMFKIEL